MGNIFDDRFTREMREGWKRFADEAKREYDKNVKPFVEMVTETLTAPAPEPTHKSPLDGCRWEQYPTADETFRARVEKLLYEFRQVRTVRVAIPTYLGATHESPIEVRVTLSDGTNWKCEAPQSAFLAATDAELRLWVYRLVGKVEAPA